ncbi:lasso peptide biosynthesis B2 protein [Chloracidobacterium validum]|uniref:Lasso peptide biosynthesis B2 protein n=1 Tax=Chloracidobacterium validum TaxID=2821543 RepID=A0ABX8B6W2_9BACT|nr:lasso peptide biosynthesis B2 protein [Chloracidobacterium validum]
MWPQIRWGTLPNILARLDNLPERGLTALTPEALAQTARAVVHRLPRFGVGECLLRSLVIYAMLRCQRQAGVAFVLGAGSLDDVGRPALHCWIETNGQPLLEMANPIGCFHVLLRHRMPTAS